ncbi:MAG: SulP family inorganic anion transporter [Methylocystaceae bacterium]|nr:SulP family inorganic anion transporter [Methylocystaceae bacterium]
MKPQSHFYLRSFLPFLYWIPKVTTKTIQSDLIAAFTNAAIALPQSVAFAAIAGLPPEYGLFTAMVPSVFAAFFGSSMVMISGPTTAISAVIFSALSGRYEIGSPAFIEATLTLTFIVGLIQLFFGIAKLGKLATFVSHSVMVGFTAAAAILIAMSQLSGALGVQVKGGGSILERVNSLWPLLDQTNWRAVLITVTTLTVTALMTRYAKRLPCFLIALIAGTGLSILLDATAHDINTIEALPRILPIFSIPSLSLDEIQNLSEIAIVLALIGLLEAVAIGRAFALKTETSFNANQEVIGQGISNLAGGLFQAYPSSGSFTRSGLNYEAGAKTPFSAIFSCVFLLIILLVIAPLLAYIPIPAMSGLIIFVAFRLINFSEIKHFIHSSKSETTIILITLFVGVFVELELSLFLGVILSLMFFIQRTMRPHFAIGAPDPSLPDRSFRDSKLYQLNECPQLLSLRFNGPLYFGSIEYLELGFKYIAQERPQQKTILINLKGAGDIDLSGIDLLIAEANRRRKIGGDLYVVMRAPFLVSRIRKLGLLAFLGEDHQFESKRTAIATLVPKLDKAICMSCPHTIFNECQNNKGIQS